jgi:hypothetical protein
LNDQHLPSRAFPSLGAYSLWTWARSHPYQFGGPLWSKAEVARVQERRPIADPVFVLAAFDFEERRSKRQDAMIADIEKAVADVAHRAMQIVCVLTPDLAKDNAEAFGARLRRLSLTHVRATLN